MEDSNKKKNVGKFVSFFGFHLFVFFLFVFLASQVLGTPGSCGNQAFECSQGTFYPAPPTASAYQWLCLGTDGNSDASCTFDFYQKENPAACPPIFSPGVIGCTTGSFIPTSLQISGDVIQFVCQDSVSISGVRTGYGWDTRCKLPNIPINHAVPICAQATNTCVLGDPVNQTNILGVNVWFCTISYDGVTNQTTQCSNQALNPLDRTQDSNNVPVDGICSILSGCFSGVPSGLAPSPYQSTSWDCLGFAGGESASCTKTGSTSSFGTAITQTCGDQAYTCASGLQATKGVLDSVAYWTCSDPATASDRPALCSLGTPTQDPINGVCGSEENTCSSGTLTADISQDPVYGVRWSCSGFGGGDSEICSSLDVFSDGKCGTVVNSCDAGIFEDETDTITDHKWACTGTIGGSNASCSYPILGDYEIGSCSNQTFQCDSGNVSNQETQTMFGSVFFRWQCSGQSGGASDQCETSVEGDPVCGTDQFVCAIGQILNPRISGTNANWNCRSNNITVSCSETIEDRDQPRPTTDFLNPGSRANTCQVLAFWDETPSAAEVFAMSFVAIAIVAGLATLVVKNWMGGVVGGLATMAILTTFGCMPATFLVLLLLILGLVLGIGFFYLRRGS